MICLLKKACATLLLLLTAMMTSAGEEDRIFYAYDASNGLADNSAQVVMCTKTGRIAVSTIGHVNFFDGSSFVHADPLPEDIAPLPGYGGGYQICFDRFHHMWVKNDRMMTCVDLLTERFIRDVPAEIRKMGVSENVADFYGDGESNIWFRSGQRIFSPALKKSFKISHPSDVFDVDVFGDSLLLMFHKDGSLAVYDYKTQRFLRRDAPFSADEESRYDKPSAICLIGHDYYQLRNGDGRSVMLRYHIDAHKWEWLMEVPFHMNALCPYEDRLYIGAERGYIVYNLSSGAYRHYPTLYLTKGRQQVPKVNSLCFDRQGGLWIGTDRRGLLYCKPFGAPFKVCSPESPEGLRYGRMMDQQVQASEPLPRKVNCVFTDSRGWRWTGSYNGVMLERGDGSQRRFTHKDGLTNEVVHSIVEDDQHHVWAATSFGVARLMVRDGDVYHVEVYTNQDNVPNETFLNGRVAKLPDGTIVMQSLDHYMYFNPRLMQADRMGSVKLYPKLVRLEVNGTGLEAGDELEGRVIIDRAVSRVRNFSVNYDQNSILMVFSGLNYVRPIQTYYRVRVQGLAGYEEWRTLSYGKSGGLVDNKGLLRLPLLSLKPGHYRVELQASLWPETWPQEPYVWEFDVEEPWWRTTGLYLLLGVLVLAMLLVNFYYFNRNTRLLTMCNNAEDELVRRVRSYASRCALMHSELLSPFVASGDQSKKSDLSAGFIDVMLKIVPYVNQLQGQRFTMRQLSNLTGVELSELYSLMASNLDKSPRELVGCLRLQEAAQLLLTTDASVDAIASQCGFVTPDYFISSFYHKYRLTPQDYRSTRAR